MNVRCTDQVMCQTIQAQFFLSRENFSLLQNIQAGSGTNPASYSMVPGVLCVLEKWLQLKKSDQSPTSGAMIKNACSKVVPSCTCHCHSVGSQKCAVFITI